MTVPGKPNGDLAPGTLRSILGHAEAAVQVARPEKEPPASVPTSRPASVPLAQSGRRAAAPAFLYPRGRPSPRVAMMFRCTSLVPPAIVDETACT